MTHRDEEIASALPVNLLAAFRNVPAFVTSVIVLGIFWRGHWLWGRRYGLDLFFPLC